MESPPLPVLGLDTTDSNAQAKLLQQACETFADPIFVKNRQHQWIAGNKAFFDLFGLPSSAVLGKSDPDFFPPEQVEVFWTADDALFNSGESSSNKENLTSQDGQERTIWTRKYPIYNQSGQIVALSGIITDVTDLRGQLEKALRLETELRDQQRIIQAQSQLLGQLAVPVIQIWEGILLLPLIGEINAQRAAQVMESLLNAITEHRAQFALIDITGVPVVDAAVAGYLVQSVQAARLLGCQSMMVGVGAAVANQMVKLNVDFSTLRTQATLQQGLELAMKQLSYFVQHTPVRRR